MASEKPEADGFLAVIEQRIAALTQLAQSFRAAMALGALGQPGEIDIFPGPGMLGVTGLKPSVQITELPKGALLGRSLPAAVELYLTSVRGKAAIREIANALKAGGVESTSDNFENVVSGALHRLKAQGKVLRFKDGWALAELYPSSLRSSLGKDTKSGARATKATKRVTARKVKAKADDSSPDENKSELIATALRTDPAHALSPNEIVAALRRINVDATPDYVRLVLRRLAARGRVEKREGKYFRIETAA